MFKSTSKGSGAHVAEMNSAAEEIIKLREEVQYLRVRVRELEALAGNDDLVGLPNRRSFLQSLERLIDRVSRYDETAAVIFVDVDGLKQINDTMGHSAGDAALKEIARLLADTVRQSDRVGRLAGDEFGILLNPVDERGAWQMALRVVERVAASQHIFDGKPLPLSIAVGVGMIGPNDTALDALARADEQMYRIKQANGCGTKSRLR